MKQDLSNPEANMVALSNRREGFALVGAVLAMLVVGAIVTGGFYAANQQSQVVRSTHLGDMAQYIAETGLEAAMGRTAGKAYNKIDANQDSVIFTNVPVSYGGRVVGTYTVSVLRTQGSLYLVRSTGTVTSGGAAQQGITRTVANMVRLRSIDFDKESAMQVYGNLVVGGTADIEGADRNLGSTWAEDECTTNSTAAAVTALPPPAIVTEMGSGDIDGPITRKPMTSDDFLVFGDMTWNEVKALANRVYAPGAQLSQIAANCTPSGCGSTSVCNTTVTSNWGAPESTTNPCRNHFPIIYAQGDLGISANGTGQGILLVEGNFTLTSQFKFYGPVVVRGIFDVGAGGSEIIGSVIAYGGGVIGSSTTVAGNAVVQYSSCSIKRAVLGATGLSRGMPIRNRSWIDITNVQNSF
jgi:hypothetical protein